MTEQGRERQRQEYANRFPWYDRQRNELRREADQAVVDELYTGAGENQDLHTGQIRREERIEDSLQALELDSLGESSRRTLSGIIRRLVAVGACDSIRDPRNGRKKVLLVHEELVRQLRVGSTRRSEPTRPVGYPVVPSRERTRRLMSRLESAPEPIGIDRLSEDDSLGALQREVFKQRLYADLETAPDLDPGTLEDISFRIGVRSKASDPFEYIRSDEEQSPAERKISGVESNVDTGRVQWHRLDGAWQYRFLPTIGYQSTRAFEIIAGEELAGDFDAAFAASTLSELATDAKAWDEPLYERLVGSIEALNVNRALIIAEDVQTDLGSEEVLDLEFTSIGRIAERLREAGSERGKMTPNTVPRDAKALLQEFRDGTGTSELDDTEAGRFERICTHLTEKNPLKQWENKLAVYVEIESDADSVRLNRTARQTDRILRQYVRNVERGLSLDTDEESNTPSSSTSGHSADTGVVRSDRREDHVRLAALIGVPAVDSARTRGGDGR